MGWRLRGAAAAGRHLGAHSPHAALHLACSASGHPPPPCAHGATIAAQSGSSSLAHTRRHTPHVSGHRLVDGVRARSAHGPRLGRWVVTASDPRHIQHRRSASSTRHTPEGVQPGPWAASRKLGVTSSISPCMAPILSTSRYQRLGPSRSGMHRAPTWSSAHARGWSSAAMATTLPTSCFCAGAMGAGARHRTWVAASSLSATSQCSHDRIRSCFPSETPKDPKRGGAAQNRGHIASQFSIIIHQLIFCHGKVRDAPPGSRGDFGLLTRAVLQEKGRGRAPEGGKADSGASTPQFQQNAAPSASPAQLPPGLPPPHSPPAQCITPRVPHPSRPVPMVVRRTRRSG